MRQPTDKLDDSRDFVIGILSTTAAILLVGLLVINTRPEPAMADGMTTTSGSYVMTVGSVTPDEEYVYILKSPAERLIAYRFNDTRQQIEIVQGIDLAELRSSASGQSTSPQRGRRPGSRGRRP